MRAEMVDNGDMRRRKLYCNLDPSYKAPGRRSAWSYFMRRLSSAVRERPDKIEDIMLNEDVERSLWNGVEATHDIAVWVGHSTVLCRQEGRYFLTDPIFSERASPIPFLGPRRYTKPAFSAGEMPRVDFVLISHSHYDHLDLPSVLAIQQMYAPLFFVPEGLKRWFKRRGLHNTVELPWWGTHTVGGVTVTAVPAQHYSSRTPWDRNKSHWCGWVVKGEKTFYYPGDTGYGPFFAEIGKRCGPVDLAAMPIGAYSPQHLIRQHHLNPEESLDVFRDVGGKKFLAVHWGAFEMTEEPWHEPPARLMAEARRRGLRDDGVINVVRIGDTIVW